MITHTNRKGQRYILKTATRAGKPRWYASMKAQKGTNAKSMQDGYAFYEDVNGQVFVRKPLKTKILPAETDAVERMSYRGPEPHWYLLRVESTLPEVLKEFIPLVDDEENGNEGSVFPGHGLGGPRTILDPALSPKKRTADFTAFP